MGVIASPRRIAPRGAYIRTRDVRNERNSKGGSVAQIILFVARVRARNSDMFADGRLMQVAGIY